MSEKKEKKLTTNRNSKWYPKPFPYYGSKQAAVDIIWALAKDTARCLIEPFSGSACVALSAPDHIKNVVLNDSNAMLVNFWRALEKDPDGVLSHATRPVSDLDMWAVEFATKEWAKNHITRLAAELDYSDVRMAGLWLYGQCNYLASNFGTLTGPWHAVVGEDGHKHMTQVPNMKGDKGIRAQVPDMGCDRGIRAKVPEKKMTWGDALKILQERLHRFRILCGDWKRSVTKGLLHEYDKDGQAFIFLDPPYDDTLGKGTGVSYVGTEGAGDYYHVGKEVREWCKTKTSVPCPYTIVLCGRYGEHDELLSIPGWTKVAGKAKSSYAKDKTAHQQEYLWCWNANVPESPDN